MSRLQRLGELTGGLRVLRSEAEETREKVIEVTEDLEQRIEKSRSDGLSALADLRARLNTENNNWDKELATMIEAVELGLLRVSDLLRLYSDASIGGERLIEILGRIDTASITADIQGLAREITSGSASIEEALKRLRNTTNKWAQDLLAVVEAFRKGEATLDRVRQTVEAIRKQNPGSDFGELAQSILDALQEGSL